MERDTVINKLREYIITELVNNPDYDLAADEKIISTGLVDSFALARISVFIEEQFNVYIPDNDLTVANMDTLNQMADRILQEV